MVDSGANQNYVSRRMAQQLKEYEQNKDIPYPVNTANGKFMEFVTKQLHEIPMTIGKHTERISLDIVDLPKYDVVLGMAWLHDHNPTIDWKTRTLEFPTCRTDKTEDRSSSKVPVARAIWVRPVGRTIAELGQEQELPPEYKEFKQLFEKREGSSALPEHKPWDHKIDFVE
ncbi:Aspartic peptidase domain, partial [Lasallia pustulata]